MAMDYPLRIEAGATYERAFRLTDKTSQTLFDLTGYTVKAQVRQHPSSALALELDVTTDIPNSIINLVIPAEDTSSLIEGPYFWGLELTETATGNVKRLIEGKVYVTPEVVY